ncbi:MAG: polysaccharide biosynthesis/export family protein [Chthoniobacter sp.]
MPRKCAAPAREGRAKKSWCRSENLEVFVNEDPSFNGIYQVRRGGYIIMPQVGRITVAGKSLSAAEAAVKRPCKVRSLHSASVMIERKQGADIENGPLIYLSGEFRRPGQWHIPTGITPTLVNVNLSSGGVSDKADLTVSGSCASPPARASSKR